jgi:AraC-like DNA-binding protein
MIDAVGRALGMAFAMGWEILWPLILGFTLSGVVQAIVSRGEMSRLLIDSLRLDHAARLLRRRALASTGQPISEIAYASGFNDYSYFSQKFRRRFGYAPSAHAGNGPPEEVRLTKASVSFLPDRPNEA